jgi:UDP-glucuronate decarboxylase
MSRIVVTGAAGFIGTHLSAHLLAGGHEVIGLDNLFTGSKGNLRILQAHPNFEFVRHDVCEPWHIECDQLFHLACPASPVHYQRNPARTIETGVVGTRNALVAARAVGARVVFTSTSEVYGSPAQHPQTEEYWGHVNCVGPRACYDESKRAGETLCVAFADQYKVDVRIARLFNTYGPRMGSGDGRIISNFITQALKKEPITVFGDGSQTRSFCYVGDTIEALVRLMHVSFVNRQNIPTPIVNIGNPDERTVLSVAETVVQILGGTIERRSLPVDDPTRRCPDIRRARSWLEWEPKIAFQEGLRYTIDWFR